MNALTLFCPACDTLLIPLDAPRLLEICPACGWEAPAGVEPGRPLGAPLKLPLDPLPGLAPCLAPGGLWLGGMREGRGALCRLPWGGRAAQHSLPSPEGWTPRGLALARETLLFSPDEQEISGPSKALVGLEAHTGEERWRCSTPGFLLTPPAGDAALAAAVDNLGNLLALDPGDGAVRWGPLSLGDFPPQGAPPVLTDELLLAVEPRAAGGLRAYDRQSGELRWRFQSPLGEPVDFPPAALEGRAYVIAGGRLYALDLANGREVWHYAAPRRASRGWFFTPPLAAAGLVLALGGDYHPQRGPAYALQALDAGSGELRWCHFLAHTVNLPPAAAGGLVLLLDRYGSLTALDAHTGEQRWTTDLGAKPAVPMLAFGGRLYVVTRDGCLHAIALHAPQRAPDQPPAFYADRGQWVWAAAAHLLRGQPRPAVEALLHGGDFDHALALSRLIAYPAGEIHALLALGREAEARDLIPHLEDPAARGTIKAQLGEHAGAAEDFQAAERWQEAIGELEAAGDAPSLACAAEIAAGHLHDISRAQRFYQRAGEKALAAGQPDPAWRYFYRATDFGQARKAHRRAVDAAGMQNLDREQANLLIAWVEQERARRTDRGVLGDTHLAGMLEEAADALARAGESEACDQCRERAAQILEMPRFHLQVSAPEGTTLVQGRSSILHITLTNIGYGPAKEVRLVVGGSVETPCERTFTDLYVKKPQAWKTVQVTPTVAGDAVLRIEMQFWAYRSGEQGRAVIEESVPVQEGGLLQKLIKGQVPLEINIEKYLAPGASSTEMTISDSVFVRSPISGGGGSTTAEVRDVVFVRSPIEGELTATEEGAVLQLGEGPRCSKCGHLSEPGSVRCQGCGQALAIGED